MSSDEGPVFSAADLLAFKRERGLLPPIAPPGAVILAFQKDLVGHAISRYPAQRVGGFYGDMYLFKRTQGRVSLIGNFGMGAPVTAALVDELAAFGVQRFLAIGLAGGLQPHLRPGDVVICERAWRGEGTSGHYQPPGEIVEAATAIVRGWSGALSRRGHVHALGGSWTTDAPYRELRGAVLQHQQQGIATVEMEAAALLAVGQALGRPAGAAFCIADTLVDGRWRLEGDTRLLQKGLQILFESALDYLTSEP